MQAAHKKEIIMKWHPGKWLPGRITKIGGIAYSLMIAIWVGGIAYGHFHPATWIGRIIGMGLPGVYVYIAVIAILFGIAEYIAKAKGKPFVIKVAVKDIIKDADQAQAPIAQAGAEQTNQQE
jgi:hypothetical protein